MALSKSERLRRKRESEKKRRERIRDDPQSAAEENEKRRQRYACKKEENEKHPKKESKRVIEERRKKWRIAKQKYMAKKKSTKKHATSSASNSARMMTRKRNERKMVSLDAVDDEYEQSFDNEEFLETQDSPHDLLTVSFQACDDESYTNHQIKEESKDEDSETEIASRCSAPFEDEPASSTAHSLTFSNLVAEVGTPRSYFSTNKSPVSSSNAPFESSTFRRTSSDQNKNSFRGGVVDTSLGQMDEFDIFGKNVGIQLKQLPLENALELQAKIHQLIIAERLKVIRQNKKNGLIIEDNDDAEDDSDL